MGNRLANENLSCFRLDELQQELEARSRPIRMPLEISSANENLSCFRVDELQQELEARFRPIRMPLEISSANENLFCFRVDELQQELEAKMAEIRKCGVNYTALTTKLGTVRNKSI